MSVLGTVLLRSFLQSVQRPPLRVTFKASVSLSYPPSLVEAVFFKASFLTGSLTGHSGFSHTSPFFSPRFQKPVVLSYLPIGYAYRLHLRDRLILVGTPYIQEPLNIRRAPFPGAYHYSY